MTRAQRGRALRRKNRIDLCCAVAYNKGYMTTSSLHRILGPTYYRNNFLHYESSGIAFPDHVE